MIINRDHIGTKVLNIIQFCVSAVLSSLCHNGRLRFFQDVRALFEDRVSIFCEAYIAIAVHRKRLVYISAKIGSSGKLEFCRGCHPVYVSARVSIVTDKASAVCRLLVFFESKIKVPIFVIKHRCSVIRPGHPFCVVRRHVISIFGGFVSIRSKNLCPVTVPLPYDVCRAFWPRTGIFYDHLKYAVRQNKTVRRTGLCQVVCALFDVAELYTPCIGSGKLRGFGSIVRCSGQFESRTAYIKAIPITIYGKALLSEREISVNSRGFFKNVALIRRALFVCIIDSVYSDLPCSVYYKRMLCRI